MLCQYCGKNPAAVHVKSISDGKLTEFSLCAECARELGCGNLLTGLGSGFSGVLRELFGNGEEEYEEPRCGCCGTSFSDIAKSGKVGCAECYQVFNDRLLPLIQQIHGSVVYRGKIPGDDLPRVRPGGQLSVMHQKLREAISSENFEQAAVLRDRIRALEGEGGEKE